MSDKLTPKQRSYCMARVKNKGTDLETFVRKELRGHACRFTTNVKGLPGSPDIVFSGAKVVVFIDGDFWHGYRFPTWQRSVSSFWQKKISNNRRRDQRNFRRARNMGWRVVRIWQHDLEQNPALCITKIMSAISCSRDTVQ